MYLVDYIAKESFSASEEMDLEGADNFTEARELAEKQIKLMYPAIEDIEVIKIEEIK